jgi:hypothetical protein
MEINNNNNNSSSDGNNSDSSQENNKRKAGRPIGSVRPKEPKEAKPKITKTKDPKDYKKRGRQTGVVFKTKEEKLLRRTEWFKEYYAYDVEAHERQKERMRNWYHNKKKNIVIELV